MRFSSQTPPPATELPSSTSNPPEKTIWGFVSYLIRGDESTPLKSSTATPSQVMISELKPNDVNLGTETQINEDQQIPGLVDTLPAAESDDNHSATSSLLVEERITDVSIMTTEVLSDTISSTGAAEPSSELGASVGPEDGSEHLNQGPIECVPEETPPCCTDERVAELSITTTEAMSDTVSSTGAVAPSSDANPSVGSENDSERLNQALVDECAVQENPPMFIVGGQVSDQSHITEGWDNQTSAHLGDKESSGMINGLSSPKAKDIEARNSRELFSSAFSALSFPESVESSEQQSEVSQTVNQDEDFAITQPDQNIELKTDDSICETRRCVVCGRRGLAVHMARNRCVSI